jgi:hypothetical protein
MRVNEKMGEQSVHRDVARKLAPQDARRAGPHVATANHRQYGVIISRLLMLMAGSRASAESAAARPSGLHRPRGSGIP